jgi:alcohol dehydrogenase (cytochrome c)
MGIFAALDMKTNRLVWQQAWKDACYSGSVTTAGGLVFVGRNDGRLTALNSSRGKGLWEFQTGAGVNAPASVFAYEGEEYVIAYSAGSLFADAPRGDSVWLFSLKGTMQEAAPASTTLPPVVASAPVMPDLANGEKIFREICSLCHGFSGEGGHRGPSLANVRDVAKIAQVVQQGGVQMPSFGSSLTVKNIHDVSSYVRAKLVH